MYRGVNLQTAGSKTPSLQFAKYTPNLTYNLIAPRPLLRYLPFDRSYFRTPNIDAKYKHAVFTDKVVDFTEKEQLDESEAMRGPRERDYYQDHSYYDMWSERDLSKDQAKQLTDAYGWMIPGSEIKPWIWYAGDTVEVVKGPFAGQRGTILNIVKYKNQCFVQNVNVQPIVVPASESRPEQTILREHPIDVRVVKLVDPETNEPCDVKLVTVRDKETGKKVERRMSLATGALLPLPKPSNDVETGDPMYDTPLEDAEEPTYMPDKELPVMTARKLRAMEDHFVETLKVANSHHDAYRRDNTKHLRMYQQQVVKSSASQLLASALNGDFIIPDAQLAMWQEAVAEVELPAVDGDEDGSELGAADHAVAAAEENTEDDMAPAVDVKDAAV